ncbi:carbonic anhydrase [Pedomonas mirosovicensis]|uniref:carbonic anhydrase n=1 Tax=Pedomonas mirosovicensis TaxID=2908641 RepID=UPI0021698F87|nr:carbonic anhydrase [Pedomonas mirosovicensis]MCH8685250.1 carbonic anhydrase [Pedomonas mirosovicensis]
MSDESQDATPSQREFEALIDGYRRFRKETYNRHRERYDSLANKGQSPKVMVIACCDSRVDPTIIFDAEPGQMFVLRNVANLVPPFETGTSGSRHGASAAIEFAVTGLEVEHIVVMGHARCGGIAASLAGKLGREEKLGEPISFIDRWMSIINPVRDQILMAYEIAPDMDPQRALELAAIRQSLQNLRTFPFVEEREKAGTLKLHGAYFAVADGILQLMEAGTDQFKPVELPWD